MTTRERDALIAREILGRKVFWRNIPWGGTDSNDPVRAVEDFTRNPAACVRAMEALRAQGYDVRVLADHRGYLCHLIKHDDGGRCRIMHKEPFADFCTAVAEALYQVAQQMEGT